VNCEKTEEKSVQIFILYERSFSLVMHWPRFFVPPEMHPYQRTLITHNVAVVKWSW